ncbi:MAG: glucosamine-6-phosphate deaminase [Caldibacillus debilis]|uniref:Glucosamine-6-phosphate deaminase n=1 Tax=Caldibacillus debilis TaxID=301148 RepID=A0A3E0K381_9BACI|nr:glucosamine-6-phosphate deaminase [Caldibacillus debilis]MBY6271789.1 glucosamine-6-phosphate deaminase [Bacillaceae bacterium]OUM93250.1 MAG: glucosamine-6-phosphate deaminase [Caldibacillus debilis]REJ13892.1 MAG: glucosamine-6-phosphate deaminase [Caldibacillus debilis]REJ27644.1 MAG: glucosamine-6-phosphate deaminase [Caldibacillus debilis]REJ30790.1 MAG: glucosamine-6-phosphate deaminase [Caldibacillus debilis]
MEVIVAKNYEDMSKKACAHIVSRIKEKPDLVLGLATGSTPIGLYQNLIAEYKNNNISFRRVVTFNLDEYVGLDGNDPNSYRYFMDHQLFNHIDIDKNNTFIPNGTAENIEEECKNYEALIKKFGGIDLQILGIGRNGHIGFNEPGSPFNSRTQYIRLAESTRQANSRFFPSLDDVPTHAITMGIGTILEAKEILLLISGKGKQEAVRRLFTEEPNEDFPASAIKTHPKVFVFVDEDALASESGKDLQELLAK